MPRLISVNVGLPRNITWQGRTVCTAIWKAPAASRCMVRKLNVAGDGQGDLAGHGGEHRAVMVYQLQSYRYWEGTLKRSDFTYGQFGENFTVDGLPDDQVCIGDRYRIGSALFEVTQPRVTCYRVGIRMGVAEMAALLVSHHRPGFYFRVLEEGEVGEGDEIVKVLDGPERVTVTEVDALLYLPRNTPSHTPGHTPSSLERALRIPALSPGWKSSLQALLRQGSGAGNAGLVPSAPPPAWQGFQPLLVQRVDRESGSVKSFTLQTPTSSPLPAALPGQFLVLKLQPEPPAPSLLRSYSLSGKPGAQGYRVSVKREDHGAASSFLHSHVAAGAMLPVSAPRGTFTLNPGDGPVVLISAGIGVTPVLAMLHALAFTPRQVWWLYGTRDGAHHPFFQEARQLLNSIPQGRSHIVYSHPVAGDVRGEHYDAEGHLNGSVIAQLDLPLAADFYICGPTSFMRDLTLALVERNVPHSQIHTETFGPEDSITPGIAHAPPAPVHAPAGSPGTGPQVSFTRSGLTVPWDDRYQSLLELAEACGVPVKWSCRTGVCHTCESALIGGAVEYRPAPLDLPAPGSILICCSQPKGEIQIDL